LNGELNTKLINFTPTIGQTFTIMNYSSKTGTFTSCDGRSGGTTCPINSSEHFTITYNPTDVVLTVVKGAAPVVGQFNRLSVVDPPCSTAMPSRFGFGLYGTGRNFQHLSSRASAMVASGAVMVDRPLLASQAPTEIIRSPRSIVGFSGSSKFINAAAIGLGTRATLSGQGLFWPKPDSRGETDFHGSGNPPERAELDYGDRSCSQFPCRHPAAWLCQRG